MNKPECWLSQDCPLLRHWDPESAALGSPPLKQEFWFPAWPTGLSPSLGAQVRKSNAFRLKCVKSSGLGNLEPWSLQQTGEYLKAYT